MSGTGNVFGAAEFLASLLDVVNAATMQGFVSATVWTKCSLLSTDGHAAYRHLSGSFNHGAVDHHRKQYVVGALHTNTIEVFWSLIKRGVMGSYHKVSRKYLPLYVAEFQFPYNNSSNPDIFGEAIKGFYLGHGFGSALGRTQFLTKHRIIGGTVLSRNPP
jgi:ISXO2 transposase-like protein